MPTISLPFDTATKLAGSLPGLTSVTTLPKTAASSPSHLDSAVEGRRFQYWGFTKTGITLEPESTSITIPLVGSRRTATTSASAPSLDGLSETFTVQRSQMRQTSCTINPRIARHVAVSAPSRTRSLMVVLGKKSSS